MARRTQAKLAWTVINTPESRRPIARRDGRLSEVWIMGLLKLETLAQTPLQTDPFDYVVVDSFLDEAAKAQILGGFPQMSDAGSFPLSEVEVGPGLQALFDALDGPAFRAAIEKKFSLDLAGRPTMFTVRGRCDARDGRIHTDSKKKIITVLLYLNEGWQEDGGRLRLLRSGEDLNATAAEVSPAFGSLLVFRRSDRSFHGHEPYVGPRKVIQMNWVVSDHVAAWEQLRHRISAAAKRLRGGRGEAGRRRAHAA
jgi:SM-20-related protein